MHNTPIHLLEKVARAAGENLLHTQPDAVSIVSKDPYKDFVTQSDRTTEDFIISELRSLLRYIPDFYGEETAGDSKPSDDCFVIDPIDGTVNYFSQDFFWGVSIAHVVKGETTQGVIFLPKLNLLLSAEGGWPAMETGPFLMRRSPQSVPLCVSKKEDFAKANIWIDWPKKDPRTMEKTVDATLAVTRALAIHALYPQTRLCGTVSLAMVATGKIDGYIHPEPDPFSIAAGIALVKAAGGTVTDFAGNPATPFSKTLAVSNGRIHEELLTILASATVTARS